MLKVSNVLWSNGFHPGFDWIDLPVFDARGAPRHRSGVVDAQPGLYFVGLPFLHAMSSSMIHGVGRDAARIAGGSSGAAWCLQPQDDLGEILQVVPPPEMATRTTFSACSATSISHNIATMLRTIFAGVVVALLLTNAYAGEPEVRSASALVVDAKSGEVLFEREPGLVTPIASISKLMTALVVIDAQQPLDQVIEITADDRWTGQGRLLAHSPRCEADARRPAAPGADGVGEPRRANPGAQLSGRHGRVHRHDEPEGQGARDDARRASTILPGCRATMCRMRATWRS